MEVQFCAVRLHRKSVKSPRDWSSIGCDYFLIENWLVNSCIKTEAKLTHSKTFAPIVNAAIRIY
jgi:hypothetical protein